MMANAHKLFLAKVMHKRFLPKVNAFSYGVYYLMLKLSEVESLNDLKYLKLNKLGILSFFDKDHGLKNNSSALSWAKDILNEHNITEADGEIYLITFPRVLNYIFNPVSFYFCLNKSEKLCAVICEVNNTFGETHTYICTAEDNSEINSDTIIKSRKFFHVSPFMERQGYYEFRFDLREDKLGIWIDHFDEDGSKRLITSLIGNLFPLTDTNIRMAFWKHPLVTFKAISLIHWQAIRLLFKKIKYVPKPLQNNEKITKTNITNL